MKRGNLGVKTATRRWEGSPKGFPSRRRPGTEIGSKCGVAPRIAAPDHAQQTAAAAHNQRGKFLKKPMPTPSKFKQ